MHENIVRLLMENSVRQLYVTSRSALNAARRLSVTYPLHCDVSTNEKIAYELALAGAYAGKRTACIVSTEGLYDALDPVMSSAYTGVAGSFVIIAVQENVEEITPLGFFSKLPVIVTETDEELERAVAYAFSLSEEYRIPVIVQAFPGGYGTGAAAAPPEGPPPELKNAFLKKEPGRWAATPKFRYQLHGELNDKIRKIRDAFETYEGNIVLPKGTTGLITDKFSRLEFYDEDASILRLATVFPLPEKLTQRFIDAMDEVLVVETYPAIELQIPDRAKVQSGFVDRGRGRPQFEEKIQGFTVVRDRLGPASSINMAHGIKKLHPDRNIMAVTFEDHFFHSGMPAYVNSLYNDSASVLLIMVNERDNELKRAFESYGVENVFDINEITEIAQFKDTKGPVVLLYRGMI